MSNKTCVKLLVFVAGYHHSGTTLVQHMLLNASGHVRQTRAPESWPSSCNSLPVLKHPTNTVEDVNKLWKVRAHVVFMTRDGANTVWSILKRLSHTHDKRAAEEEVKKYCSVHCRWKMRPRLDSTTLSLARTTHEGLPESLLSRVAKRRMLSERPPDKKNNKLRQYQITHGIYYYNASVVNQASGEIRNILRRADRCKCSALNMVG